MIATQILRTMRPKQWAKNVFLFAPLVFAQRMFVVHDLLRSLAGFAVFCLLASCVYIVNDIADVEKDRQHPRKRRRPIASGSLSPTMARNVALALVPACLIGALLLDPIFAALSAAYFVLNLGYSWKLKHIAYADVLSIASGFLLRVLAGSAVIPVEISKWLVPCTFLLALFLALGKRKHELVAHGSAAANQRSVLAHYKPSHLNLALGVVASATVMGYCGYVIDPTTVSKFHSHSLVYTIPFMVFGIVRFQQIIERGARAESPTEEILKDPPFVINFFLWGGAVTYVIYFAGKTAGG